jgi:hypothetical protein
MLLMLGRDAAFADLVEHVDEVTGRARQPIEAGDHQHVAGFELAKINCGPRRRARSNTSLLIRPREWRSAAPHFDRRFAASFGRDLVRLRAAP